MKRNSFGFTYLRKTKLGTHSVAGFLFWDPPLLPVHQKQHWVLGTHPVLGSPGGTKTSARASAMVSKVPVSCHAGGHPGRSQGADLAGAMEPAPWPGPLCESNGDEGGHDGQNAPTQPIPSYRHPRYRFPPQEPPRCQAGRSEQGWGAAAPGQGDAQGPLSANQTTATTPRLCCIPHQGRAAAAGAFYPHSTKRKENKKPGEGRKSSRETWLQPAELLHAQPLCCHLLAKLRGWGQLLLPSSSQAPALARFPTGAAEPVN